jgi:hypothetical protein
MYSTPSDVLTITDMRALNEWFKLWLFIPSIYSTNSWLLVELILNMSVLINYATKFRLWSGGIYKAFTLKLKRTSVKISSG